MKVHISVWTIPEYPKRHFFVPLGFRGYLLTIENEILYPACIKNEYVLPTGSTAIFKCKVDGQPEPDIQWSKGKWNKIKDGGRYKVYKDEKTGQNILEIEDIKRKDAGTYTVKASQRTRNCGRLGDCHRNGQTRGNGGLEGQTETHVSYTSCYCFTGTVCVCLYRIGRSKGGTCELHYAFQSSWVGSKCRT